MWNCTFFVAPKANPTMAGTGHSKDGRGRLVLYGFAVGI